MPKKIIINRLVFLLMALSLIACDYEERAKGIVLDKATKQPVTDVRITKGFTGGMPEDKYVNNRSDESGNFICRYRGYGMFGVQDLKLSFTKAGYKTAQVTLPARKQFHTVYVEKLR